jgi:hypothetical protein
MLKTVNPALRHEAKQQGEPGWLGPEAVASIEVSSEHPDFPVESILTSAGPGWRASDSGEQTIRIVFDRLRSLRRIRLEFSESDRERTQEFTLRAGATTAGPLREIVRQQWNFSPHGATSEIEDYIVSLVNVLVLELTLRPDLTRNDALATLDRWQVV